MSLPITAYSKKRYSKEQKNRVRERIKNLKLEGKSYEQIASALNSDGVKTPHGKPISLDFVRNQIWQLRKKVSLPRAALSSSTGPNKGSDTVIAILTDESLTNAKKVRLLKTYFGVKNEG